MKSRFPIVELGKYVHQISQRNRAELDMEVFSVTNSEGFTKSTDYFKKEVYSKDVSNYKIVSPGQFAYNPSRINVGSIDYLKYEFSILVSPLYIVFEGNKDIHPAYLLRYLKSGWGNAQVRANTEGAVRDSLKFKGLGNIKIPLPPLDYQIRIAHLLSKVEGLIARRKQHLQELDNLLKSTFVELFGPKSAEYANWPLVEIKDLAAEHKGAMRTGPFGSNLLHSEFTDKGDVAVLGIDNAVQNCFAWSERRYITFEKYKELENYRINPGDVIVTIMGTVGRSAVVPDDIPLAINTKHLAAITLNKEIANPVFISYAIHSSPFILNQFRSKTRGAIMSGLNLGLIKETKLKRPPIALQNAFADTHSRVNELRAAYRESLTDLENLYGALSQQAFKGELNLSCVPMPPIEIVEVKTVTATPVGDSAKPNPIINLPDTDTLPAALESVDAREATVAQWLEAYCDQLRDKSFSIQHFMKAARTRLAEAHPDDDFELAASDYDYIKAWVFKELAAGKLTQVYDDGDNCVELKATPV
ncbi:restriction endonuclease subunit S [Paracoccus marcusii]|uniref:restriction endonuclease subunit S n=1 Tax=Paracoccus marcusii TaxID=59779 RepID=UPI0032642E33